MVIVEEGEGGCPGVIIQSGKLSNAWSLLFKKKIMKKKKKKRKRRKRNLF